MKIHFQDLVLNKLSEKGIETETKIKISSI